MGKKIRKLEIGPSADRCAHLLLDNQLCFVLYTASRLMTQNYQPILEPLGLTYPQYLALLVLWERDGLTVSDLGKRLLLDSGTLSPLLKKLEHKGLISRARQSDDERRVLLKLTPQGRALKEKAMSVPGDLACRAGLENIGKLAALKRGLDDLTTVLLRNSGKAAGDG
jgi:DNA-binding MarR family transcriptional regulator